MKFEHAQNTLKYKVGDRVQVNAGAGFSAYSRGVVVEYPVPSEFYCLPKRLFVLQDGATEACWFYPDELTLLKAAESSNESGSLVQKISAENDVVSYGVNTSDNEETTMEFKVGDKVKYVGTGWDDSFSRDVVYPVTEVWAYGGGCDIDKTPVISRFYSDFELVEEHQPKAQDNSWYENGELPPVNTKCIFTREDVAVEGVILAHVRGQYSAIIQCDGDWWTGEVGEFRPWYSDEEIAVQERKKVIDAISDVLIETERMSRYTDVAAHLYDAGLRFVEDE